MFLKRIFGISWIFLNLFIKKIIDFIGSLTLIIILVVPMIMIALIIKIDSKGPVIFKQKRLTKNGKEFTLYKFRTMVNDAENMGSGLFSFSNDTRITKVGKFLRKTSLDELPQLLNIFTFKMSFVGPRPPVNYELGDYNGLSQKFKDRFRMSAGITGLAQISGRNELDWSLKVLKDNEYIEKFKKIGFILDIYIILMTIIKVFKSSDIIEDEPETIKGLTEEEKKKIMTEKVFEMTREEEK